MGILNVTPDSFSDGGKYNTLERAVAHARRMIEEGADILDIGGESTRPGAVPVSAEEEMRRVLPVIRALKEEGCPVPLSIDTFKAEVAEAALSAGASIINDVWGGRKDPAILRIAAEHRAPIVLMHNREDMNYGPDFVKDIAEDLRESVRRALAAGVAPENIIVDPGFGFAKTMPQHLELMGRLSEIVSLGYPVLLGTSRKRFIRYTLDAQANDVVEGTIATTVLGIAQGVSIVRVHDVKENVKAARMADAILRASPAAGAAETGPRRMDTIRMERIQLYGRHGVYPEENRLGQRFYVSLEMKLDLSAAGKTDDLAHTVDYSEVYRLVKSIVEGEPVQLLETLAETIATRILDVYAKIQEITVRVVKPHPPFEAVFDGVEVEVTRRRSGG